MKLKALIFDVDGTLAHTEREGHLPACNEAFAQLGIPLHWTWETYQQVLPLPGTPARVRQALVNLEPALDASDLEAVVEQVSRLKREIYKEKYATAAVLRRGVTDLVAAAVSADVRLAIVTLSHETQVRALLKTHLPAYADAFNPLLGKEAGPKHAPGSPLYRRCLAELGLAADEVLVIEDSEGGTAAAIEAGLPVVVAYNNYTVNGRFPGARLFTPTLASFTLEQLSFLGLEA